MSEVNIISVLGHPLLAVVLASLLTSLWGMIMMNRFGRLPATKTRTLILGVVLTLIGIAGMVAALVHWVAS